MCAHIKTAKFPHNSISFLPLALCNSVLLKKHCLNMSPRSANRGVDVPDPHITSDIDPAAGGVTWSSGNLVQIHGYWSGSVNPSMKALFDLKKGQGLWGCGQQLESADQRSS